MFSILYMDILSIPYLFYKLDKKKSCVTILCTMMLNEQISDTLL